MEISLSRNEMPSTEHLVSIIIPCYNYGHFLGEAIESALAQTHSNVEIIVVDDGSSDVTPEVAGQYKDIVYIGQNNFGVSIARNNGFAKSHGDFIVFLDADDRLLPTAIEIGLQSLSAHPECVFSFGKCRFISENGSEMPTPPLSNEVNNQYLGLLFAPNIWTPALVLFRRFILNIVGGFNPSPEIIAAEDYELFLRIARTSPIYFHNSTIAEYRQHGKNKSHDPIRMIKSITNVLNMEWKYVEGNKILENAWNSGLRLCREYYGSILISEIQNNILINHDIVRAVQGLCKLAKFYPKGLIRLIKN